MAKVFAPFASESCTIRRSRTHTAERCWDSSRSQCCAPDGDLDVTKIGERTGKATLRWDNSANW